MSDLKLAERPQTVEIRPAPPRRKWGFGTVIMVGLIAVVVIVGSMVASGFRNLAEAIPTTDDIAAVFEPKPFQEIGPVVITGIRNLAELTTIESVQYTIIEQGTDAGWLGWARGDTIKIFAVARIGAGVDLSAISLRDVSVDDRGVVEITMPKASVQYVAPDNEATQIIERDRGLFTKGDPQLESEVRRVADTVLLQSALDEGILTRASENAHRVITDFLLGLGYTDVIITVNP